MRRAGFVLVLLAAFSALASAQPNPAELDRQMLEQLLGVKRVYIERLGGGEAADQIRDMIISSFQRAKLFIVTENADRADAVLRGSAEDLVFTDTFQSSDSISARAAVGNSTTRTADNPGRRGSLSVGVGQQESTRIAERKHEASAAVRLVGKDGDVIWSTTKESLGAKFRGASADVADKITKQLIADYERARNLKAGSAPSP
ncbi:MAG: hypothetical protein HUU41_01370 [Bryobacteraceae bacterium]|nr:hypothetical protein [Bryobacterales bacterium]MEB2360150.1 hypothetical protein [Bryobacterales bacterium]NUM99739.1 hypothetical protein [Bryobacteraceae bacterium]